MLWIKTIFAKALLSAAFAYLKGKRIACMIPVGNQRVVGYYGRIVGRVWKKSPFDETTGMDILVKPEWEPNKVVRTPMNDLHFDPKTGWTFPGQPLKGKDDV